MKFRPIIIIFSILASPFVLLWFIFVVLFKLTFEGVDEVWAFLYKKKKTLHEISKEAFGDERDRM